MMEASAMKAIQLCNRSLLLLLLLSVTTTLAFQQPSASCFSSTSRTFRRHRPTRAPQSTPLFAFNEDDINNDSINNDIFQLNRRAALSKLLVGTSMASMTWTVLPSAAHAKKKTPKATQEEAFEALKRELYGENGSVAQLEAALAKGDNAALMDLTKGMDQSLRKAIMGSAKYYVVDSDKGQQLSNNVVFDLIGMNKSARPGQENPEKVAQYLQELKQDMQQMLELERQPPVSSLD
mmetsp:Transcript_9906/g.13071  ORF Transcript_9906/g.13071 Transcript_9906/m.13071 type:complete len:236 (-) Transcript_9906:181-888(-)